MSNFQIISFDTSILSSYYRAKSNLYAATSSVSSLAYSSSTDKAVTTPWDDVETASDLSDDEVMAELYGRYNAIRDKDQFIDDTTKAVLAAGNSIDEKAAFTIYAALRDLETIAEYAAYEYTPAALLDGLHAQFKAGLDEIRDYISDTTLDELTLLFGAKSARVESDVQLGKNIKEIVGSTLSIIDEDSTMADFTGTETFNITLQGGLDEDTITIDLANISGDITLKKIVTEINVQITSLTKVNSEGETVSKYTSRAAVAEDKYGDFSLNFKINQGEKFTFTAPDAEPALIIVGGQKGTDLDDVSTGILTKYDQLSTGGHKIFSQTVAGYEKDDGVAVEELDDDGNVIPTDGPAALTTSADGVATDSQGNIYVVGSSQGDFGTQLNTSNTDDVFLSKYNASGEIIWQRLLGATDSAQAFDIKIDNDDNVIIAGQIDGELEGNGVFSGKDSFVSKYDSSGTELWLQHLDTSGTDQANALAIDANGDVYVAGQINGNLSSTVVSNGGSDSFVLKLNADSGLIESSAQFGAATEDYGQAITVTNDGNIVLASLEGGDAVLRTLDSTDLSVLNTLNVGDLGGGEIADLETEGDQIYLVGSADGTLSGGGSVAAAYQGGRDGFVTRIDTTGGGLSSDWTSFIGTSSADEISGVTVEGGAVYLTGKTYGDITASGLKGTSDGFAVKIDSGTGVEEWSQQFGKESTYSEGSAIAFSSTGSSVLTKLGLPTGLVTTSETRDIQTQTSARVGDYFYISIDGGKERKITLQEGDTFESLAKRIDRLSYNKLEATFTLSSADGNGLKIEATNGGTVIISAGGEGYDLLSKLGIEPQKILPSDTLFIGTEAVGTDPDNLGGVFALNLSDSFGLRSQKEAEYVKNQLTTAVEAIKRSFRSLTYDPVKAQVLADSKNNKNYSGKVPAYLTAQLANYQSGLDKLLAVTGGTLV